MAATKLTSDNLARELLGLPPSGTELPSSSVAAFGNESSEAQYGGANLDKAKQYVMDNKKWFMIGGGVLLALIVGYAGYKYYEKQKANKPASA